jgi:hypothetical protein
LPKNNAKTLIFAPIPEDQFIQNASQNSAAGVSMPSAGVSNPHENPENAKKLL